MELFLRARGMAVAVVALLGAQWAQAGFRDARTPAAPPAAAPAATGAVARPVTGPTPPEAAPPAAAPVAQPAPAPVVVEAPKPPATVDFVPGKPIHLQLQELSDQTGAGWTVSWETNVILPTMPMRVPRDFMAAVAVVISAAREAERDEERATGVRKQNPIRARAYEDNKMLRIGEF